MSDVEIKFTRTGATTVEMTLSLKSGTTDQWEGGGVGSNKFGYVQIFPDGGGDYEVAAINPGAAVSGWGTLITGVKLSTPLTNHLGTYSIFGGGSATVSV